MDLSATDTFNSMTEEEVLTAVANSLLQNNEVYELRRAASVLEGSTMTVPSTQQPKATNHSSSSSSKTKRPPLPKMIIPKTAVGGKDVVRQKKSNASTKRRVEPNEVESPMAKARRLSSMLR